MDGRALDYVALVILIFVLLTIIYAILYIHDIPYEIAKKRKHPHQDAIHTAGWVSLFLMHTIWPFLWIWATLYRPDRGWGLQGISTEEEGEKATEEPKGDINELNLRVSLLEKQEGSRTSEEDERLENILNRLEEIERKLVDNKEV